MSLSPGDYNHIKWGQKVGAILPEKLADTSFDLIPITGIGGDAFGDRDPKTTTLRTIFPYR